MSNIINKVKSTINFVGLRDDFIPDSLLVENNKSTIQTINITKGI